MLNVDSLAWYLLDRALIDVSWIIDSNLTIRSVARRNRNLKVEGPRGSGLFLKQADYPAQGGRRRCAARRLSIGSAARNRPWRKLRGSFRAWCLVARS